MIRALRLAAVNFRAHQGLFLASGLAFTLVTCLIPVLFFVVSLAGFVLSRKAAAEVVLAQLSELVPVYKAELHEILAQIIRRRSLSGILGTAVLLIFASQLFTTLRLVLNVVFGFTGGFGFVHGAIKDLLLLFVMGVLFLASIVITDVVGWLKIILMVPIMPGEWTQSVFILLAVALNTVLFFVAYRYFPPARVPAGAALSGALLASVLWEAAKQLFRWYILTFGVYDRIYGPLGALVALSMFAYYSAWSSSSAPSTPPRSSVAPLGCSVIARPERSARVGGRQPAPCDRRGHHAQGQGRGGDGRGARDRPGDRPPDGAARRRRHRQRLRRRGGRHWAATAPADEVVDAIKAQGGQAVAYYESVASMKGGQSIVQAALDHFGRVDIVVNNAGILRDRMIFNMTEEEWDAVINTHLKGCFAVTRAASPHMREQKWGRIVNMTSTSGLVGNVGQANYAAAKLGIVGFTKVVALDMARYNVTANCISPFAWTRMIGTIPTETEAQKARVEKIKKMGPGAHRARRGVPRFRGGQGDLRPGLRRARQGDHALQPHAAGAEPPPRRGLDARAARRDVPRHPPPPSGSAGDVGAVLQLRSARVNRRGSRRPAQRRGQTLAQRRRRRRAAGRRRRSRRGLPTRETRGVTELHSSPAAGRSTSRRPVTPRRVERSPAATRARQSGE